MNLPNKLTLMRIVLIPVFLLLLVLPINLGSVVCLGTPILITRLIAALVFIVASVTDFLDGYIARSRQLITNFGKFADPLADKMLVMTAFILLVSFKIVPAWVAVIIVCRELAVTGLRLIVAETNGQVIAAAWPGKIKTATQMLAIIILMLNNVFFNNLDLPLGLILLYISLFFTVYSGIDYFVKNWQVFEHSI